MAIKRTWDEKRALITKYEAGTLTMPEFCKQYNMAKNALYTWRSDIKAGRVPKKIITTKKQDVITKHKKTFCAKGSLKPKTTPSTSAASTDLRIKLYNQLKLEYETLEAQLLIIRHRMQMVGEEWDN